MTKSNAEPGTDTRNTESDIDRFLKETHHLADQILSIHPKLHALLEKANEIQARRRKAYRLPELRFRRAFSSTNQ